MLTFVIIIHVFVSLLLIGVVLLQPGNKGGVSAALGGAGGTTVFGGQGANTFLAKLTAGCALSFMVTNFALVYFSSREGSAFDAVEWQEESAAAQAAETDEAEIRRLNPELYRGLTPPGRAYELRVPVGRAEVFGDNYASIPARERMTVVEHDVRQGETLSHIAVRYGISIRDLEAANPDVRPRYLRVGARLIVPIALAR